MKRVMAKALGRVARRWTMLGLSAMATLSLGVAADAASAAPKAKPAPVHARNVILFLGDAGGIPTLNAAGAYANDRPLSLYIQAMPHIGLSETSSLNRWVTDSAAGMTAIVTGAKTRNAMLSVVPGQGDALTPVKTILEYAEERGLSTGAITNMPIWDATPAATFAHVAARSNKDEIFRQMLAPRFGDGPDILMGKGLKDAEAVFARAGTRPADAFAKAGYLFGSDPAEIKPTTRRAAILRDDDYAPQPAVDAAIASLSRNPKGYFLMVEWDMHTDDPLKGLRHAIEMDALIRHVSGKVGKDTLILFTADHSFALRMIGGDRARPFADQYAEAAKANPKPEANTLLNVLDDHAGEEVLIAAQGPGAEQVRGFMPNTALFGLMMRAYGWTPKP